MYHQSQQEKLPDDPAVNEKAVRCLTDLGFQAVSIRQALPKLCGISHKDIADRLGVTRQAVTLTLSAKRGNHAMQAGLAEIFEVSVSTLFPERLHACCKACPLVN